MRMEEANKWFHGNLSREEAEDVLRSFGFAEGLFLVRESQSAKGDFVLCVVHNSEVIHYQIQRRGDDALFSLSVITKVIHGLDELVYFYQNHPNSGLQHSLTRFVPKYECPPSVRLHGVENLLHRSTHVGNSLVVEEILKTGDRDISAKNNDGHCAIHLAAFFGHCEILQLLIKYGASVNIANSSGYTPLHVACQSNKVDIVEILLQHSANPTIRNLISSWSPLHEAAWNGHVECAAALLRAHSPLRPRTNKDETPSDLAKANKMMKMAQFLDDWNTADPVENSSDWLTMEEVDRQRAVYLLNQHPKEGTFLIRKHQKKRNMFVLSLIFQNSSGHFFIECRGVYFSLDEGPYFKCLEQFVEHYSRFEDGLPCRLKHPLFKVLKDRTPPKVVPRPKSRERIGQPPSHLKPVDGREPYKNHDILRQVRHSRDNIPMESLLLMEVIGEGEYGIVRKGIYMPENGKGRSVAVKVLNSFDDQRRKAFERETSNMMQLGHHCVVQLIGIVQNPATMVLELVPMGSMLDYLQAKGDSVRVDLELPLWAAQVACGMIYLESQRFIHRDLAARNILLASKMQIKISDFGLSTITAQGKDYYQASQGGRWPIKWYAPECVNYGTFSHASDVWSYGVLLWEMYSLGEQPYSGLSGAEVVKFIDDGKRLLRPAKAEVDIFSMMTWCWEYEPSKRPKFTELFQFFVENPEYSNLRELVLCQDMQELTTN